MPCGKKRGGDMGGSQDPIIENGMIGLAEIGENATSGANFEEHADIVEARMPR